ncbi:MAG: hypothetical protein U9R79_20760 [Armatimonadota bacterium]|nr:hypothetical protein [Armatimonadota bacterium]
MTAARRIALLTMLVTAPAIAAETLDAGPFSVDVTPELVLRYSGETLISGDRCVSFRGMRPGEPLLVDPTGGRVIREGNIITVLARQGRNTLRREVMVTAEAVHITFEMRVFGHTGGSHLQYDLLTPAEFLEGVDYEAWTGAPRGPLETTAGTFSIEDSEPLEYLVRRARYFILKRPGAECSLDFNPAGPWVGESNYGENFSTNPYHDGTRFHFLMLCAGGRYGGIFGGKIVIRPGAVGYQSLHSTADVAYTLGFPVALAVNFSQTAAPAGDYQPYSGGASCRWRHPERVRIVERPTGGILYRDFATTADGEADGVLELAGRSGHYLLTLNVHDAEEDTGPFTVTGPDGPLFEDVTVKRGEYWFKTAPLRFRDGGAELRFTGHWKVGALTLQTILYEAEDFVLDRPFWNMTIETPHAD